MAQLFGYAGEIARVNLTTGEISSVKTEKYVPKYIGGRGIAHKIFWDEVGPGVGALDPENKLIFMTGPTTGTGIPCGGRTVLHGISPQSLPEQYSWSGIGGWFGAELKYAGYDGVIIEGRAPKPSYIWIDDGKIEICDAADLWGQYVYDTQLSIQAKHGSNVRSLVIGPAGENLVRMAIVATSNENAFGKGGFGAVFGSKNLKAIAVRGTKSLTVADPDRVLELRRKIGNPLFSKNPVVTTNSYMAIMEEGQMVQGCDPPVRKFKTCCSHGCNHRCVDAYYGVASVFDAERRINLACHCVGSAAYSWSQDQLFAPPSSFAPKNTRWSIATLIAGNLGDWDFSTEESQYMFTEHTGLKWPLWATDFDRGNAINELANQLGLNKWEVIVWLMTWIKMTQHEGLIDDKFFGAPIDVESSEFMERVLRMITYREGVGDVLAEGMARAIQVLGKEQYGNTRYTGIRQVNGEDRPVDVSVGFAWGYSSHWTGGSFQCTIPQSSWLINALRWMTSTRDNQPSTHHKAHLSDEMEMAKDPYEGPIGPKMAFYDEHGSEIKDSLTGCDWMFPIPNWPSVEAEIFTAVTGVETSTGALDHAAEMLFNLSRASPPDKIRCTPLP